MPGQDLFPPFRTSALLPVPHGCFGRHGGVSPAPFDSLNLSFYTGDRPGNVMENRRRVTAALDAGHLLSVRQSHGSRILLADEYEGEGEPEGYDAMVSSRPGTGLLIQQADCQAVLLFDPRRRAIAAIHCGWRGSVLDIIGATVRCLVRYYQSRPADLLALISPSLGPCCAEFLHHERELPQWMRAFQPRPCFFDFWAISRHQLLDAGLLPEHIEKAALCTHCNPEFFSYRRAKKAGSGLEGVTGRNGSVIALT